MGEKAEGSLRYGELREQEAQAQGNEAHEALREASSFFKGSRPLAVRPQQGATGIPRERSRALKSIRIPFFSASSQRLTQRTAWGMGPASSLCFSSPAAWDSRYSPRSRQVASQTTSRKS